MNDLILWTPFNFGVDTIANKQIPKWPNRRSYRAHARIKARRKNGGAR